jgi:hypothetical protein
VYIGTLYVHTSFREKGMFYLASVKKTEKGPINTHVGESIFLFFYKGHKNVLFSKNLCGI